MSVMDIPRELDWVKERTACTADRIFIQVVEGMKKDIAERNVANSNAPVLGDFTADGKTFVIGEGGNFARRERIRLASLNGKIEAHDDFRKVVIAAEVFLNDEGRGKLRLSDGKEIEQWQFRRMVLEDLFFG